MNTYPKTLKNKVLYLFLVTLLLGDFGYSFLQYQNTQIGGDIAGGVVPAKQVKPILEDPFGIQVILADKKYPNPNRFFSHWFFKKYFRTVPLLLQKFVSPVASIYLASALIKLLTHLALLFLLAKGISQSKLGSIDFLLAALLVTPLFQANGYVRMSLINKSITYAFFYIIPLTILAFFLYPFLSHIVFNKPFKFIFFTHALLIELVLIIPFSGPLNTGISLIISLLLFFYYYQQIEPKRDIWKNISQTLKIIPRSIKLYFIPLSILCVYSLYLGTQASPFQNGLEIPSLAERYSRLPAGLFYLLTTKIGFPLFILSTLVNVFLIAKDNSNNAARIYKMSKWILVFAIIYLLALPFGGYRPYRFNIIRDDTFVPITLALIFLYGISTFHLLKSLKRYKHLFAAWVVAFLLIFEFADIPNFADNNLEKNALIEISKSTDPVVKLDCNCKILSWHVIHNPKESELNAKLLQQWGITKSRKLYYNVEPKK